MVVAVPFVLPVLLPLVVGFVILRKRYIMTSREVSLQPALWHLKAVPHEPATVPCQLHGRMHCKSSHQGINK